MLYTLGQKILLLCKDVGHISSKHENLEEGCFSYKPIKLWKNFRNIGCFKI